MNYIYSFSLRALRKLCSRTPLYYKTPTIGEEMNFDKVSGMIYDLLMSDKPCMIARFGDAELELSVNSIFVADRHHSIIKYITGRQEQWWWNEYFIKTFSELFKPITTDYIIMFGKLMIESSEYLDIQAIWGTQYRNLDYIKDKIKDTPKVGLLTLEPYWANNPWTSALKGKKVLVISMFDDLIKKQYEENRTKLFNNPEILPEFELKTMKALSYSDYTSDKFSSWFDAVQWMKDEIDKIDYDVCLISCGPPGFPIAAHVKKMGKKAVHLGGALQLLFGIKGKRWEDSNYGIEEFGVQNKYKELFNEYWIRPDEAHTPAISKGIEGGCYW